MKLSTHSHSRLLSRDEFRAGVFARDRNLCVICKEAGQDPHHIIERRLWPDGGYYLDNGATLCGRCHILAEQTTISCEEIREAAGIQVAVLPPHLYADQRYDKWGNPILPNGLRLKGELADDESVQRVLASAEGLVEYSKYVKYPRTYHLPWSPGLGKDDRVMESLDAFENRIVVATEKRDGECTTMYRDHIHARAVDSGNHPSRDRVKALWGQVAHDIPEGWRLCGENLYAKHSIAYSDLRSYFELFSIWDGLRCLSWDETREWAGLLGLALVPVLYVATWDESTIKALHRPGTEGYVVRIADSFGYGDFRKCVGKYVRKDHVQTHGGWMREAITPNKLATH